VESAASEARSRLLSEEQRIEALRTEVERALGTRQAAAAALEAALSERQRTAEGELVVAVVVGCVSVFRLCLCVRGACLGALMIVQIS